MIVGGILYEPRIVNPPIRGRQPGLVVQVTPEQITKRLPDKDRDSWNDDEPANHDCRIGGGGHARFPNRSDGRMSETTFRNAATTVPVAMLPEPSLSAT